MKFLCPEELLDNRIKVILVGVGGTGTEVLDGLARLHFGLKGLGHPHGLHVTAYDADIVSEANLGRQRFAPVDVGRPKGIALIERLNYHFGLDWTAVPEHLTPNSLPRMGWNILITCVDRAEVRASFGEAAKDARSLLTHRLWLDFGNDRHRGQAVLGHFGKQSRAYRKPDDPANVRLPNVFDLYPELADQSDEDDGPSCSLAEALREQSLWVNKYAAMGLSLLWDLLTEGSIDRHGMFFDAQRLEMRPLMIDPDTWRFMGYEPDAEAYKQEGVVA